jgi:hypothetical protein
MPNFPSGISQPGLPITPGESSEVFIPGQRGGSISPPGEMSINQPVPPANRIDRADPMNPIRWDRSESGGTFTPGS